MSTLIVGGLRGGPLVTRGLGAVEPDPDAGRVVPTAFASIVVPDRDWPGFTSTSIEGD